MKILPLWLSLVSFIAVAASPEIFAAPTVINSVVGDSTHWTATKWSHDETALFGGMPVYRRSIQQPQHYGPK